MSNSAESEAHPEEILRIRRSCPRWSQLLPIGKSQIVRSSVFWMFFVPITAKILSTVSEVLTLELLGTSFEVTFGLPFSWRLLYFASLFFAVSSVLFSIFCPAFLKRFPDYRAFQAGEHADEDMLRAFAEAVSKGQEFLCPAGDTGDWRGAVHSFSRRYCSKASQAAIDGYLRQPTPEVMGAALLAEMEQTHRAEAFEYIRLLNDTARPKARTACFAGYVIGALFILLVVLRGTWWVLISGF